MKPHAKCLFRRMSELQEEFITTIKKQTARPTDSAKEPKIRKTSHLRCSGSYLPALYIDEKELHRNTA